MICAIHKQRRAWSITQIAFQESVCQSHPQRFSLSRSEPSGSGVELCGSVWGQAWVRASSALYRWISSPLSSWVLYWDFPLQLTGWVCLSHKPVSLEVGLDIYTWKEALGSLVSAADINHVLILCLNPIFWFNWPQTPRREGYEWDLESQCSVFWKFSNDGITDWVQYLLKGLYRTLQIFLTYSRIPISVQLFTLVSFLHKHIHHLTMSAFSEGTYFHPKPK